MTQTDDFGPNRRSRKAAVARPAAASEYDEVEVARGTAAAVLGALGRMQRKLDVLAREQAERLTAIEARLTALEELFLEDDVELS